MGIFRSNTNINNELFTLKSPALMTEVVRRLRLNETYTVRKGLKNVDLYKANPVAVTFGEVMENRSASPFGLIPRMPSPFPV